MSDLAHIWGCDLNLSANGDLAVVSGSLQTQQRVIRRLMSNPNDLLYDNDYGAGFPALIGQPVTPNQIKAIASQQMKMEQGVDQTQPPVTTVSSDNTNSVVSVNIQYTDAVTSETISVGPINLGG